MPVAVNYDTQTEDLSTNLYPGAKFTGEQKSNKQKYMGRQFFAQSFKFISVLSRGPNRLYKLGAIIYLRLFEYIWSYRNRSIHNNVFQWRNNRKQFPFLDKKVGCII